MEHRSKKTSILFTLLQLMTCLLILGGTWLAVMLCLIGGDMLEMPDTPWLIPTVALGFFTVIGVSACCYTALLCFLRMCGRIKRESAFTRRNSRALHCMAVSCWVAAAIVAVTYAAYAFIWNSEVPPLALPFLFLVAVAFAFGCAGLVCEALHVLVDRAAALQQESDLTI